MIEKMKHYSIENNPTIYDEEALTVLQLVARLTGKLNELIDDRNELEKAITELYGEKMAQLVGEWLDAHPEVTTTVQDGELTIQKLVVGTLGYVTPQMFGAVGDGSSDDTKAIQDAMANHTRVYFDGKYKITQPLQLRSQMELWGNRDGYIVTDEDIAIFQGSATGVDDCYLHHLTMINKHPMPNHYHLDLLNVGMARIEHCRIETRSTSKNAVGGIMVYSTLNSVFSPLIDSCDLRDCSVVLAVTDGYMVNTNVWAQNRKFAVNIRRSSQQITNCQFVGGSEKGAVWVEDTEHGWNVGQVRLCNCFFDGSYADIQSGVGLRAKQMINSTVTGCTFWTQKEEAIILRDCGYCAITGNVFEENGKNNETQNSYNRSTPFYDIEIVGQSFYNTISGNTFDTNEFYIKPGAINTAQTSGIVTGNTVFGNTVQSFGQYRNDALNFTDSFLAYSNVFGNWFSTNQPISVIHGNMKVTGTINCTAVENNV